MTFFETPEEKLERLNTEAERNHSEAEAQFARGEAKSLEAQNFDLVEELNAHKGVLSRIGKLLGLQENETYIEAAQRYTAGTAQISNERFMLRGEVTQLKKALIAAEERISFAEQSRDNAIAQRDAVLERSKAKSASAGQRISKLVALVRRLCGEPIEVAAVEVALEEILGDDA